MVELPPLTEEELREARKSAVAEYNRKNFLWICVIIYRDPNLMHEMIHVLIIFAE